MRGSPQVFLKDLSKKFDLEYSFDSKTFRGSLKNPKNKLILEFSLDSNKVRGPWGELEISRPPVLVSEHILVPIDFGDRALRPLLTGIAPEKPKAPQSLFQADIVIDPGHGGNDYGAHLKIGHDEIREKDLTLQIAQELRAALKSKGINCLLTREDDTYLALHERTQFANRAQAKLFLSLHLNADPKKRSDGFELYVLSLSTDPNTRSFVARENQIIPDDLPEGVEKAIADLRAESNLEASLSWAKVISSALQKGSKPFGRSVKMGPFYVLYGANMPSILAELGFITDSVDRVMLRSPTQRRKLLAPVVEALASEIKKGIVQK